MSSIFFESENMNFGDESKISFWKNEERQNIEKSKISPYESLNRENSLKNLLTSMKPSFLQRTTNSHLIRQIFLSKNSDNSAFLLRKDMTTILVGTGFSETEIAGKKYPTFPDFRLPFSEKSRIRAWILWEENFDISLTIDLAKILDFPPIFATRSVIAKFRNNEIAPEILSKFRFVEIFSPQNLVRNIEGIEFFIAKNGNKNILAFSSEGIKFWFDFITFDIPSTDISPEKIFYRHSENFSLDNLDVEAGEVLEIFGEEISKNAMKFTLDTFLVDGQSVGTLAGYTLSDRKILAENGVLIFTFEEDEKLHTISRHIFIESRGFLHSSEVMKIHKELLKAIRIVYEQTREQNPEIERWQLVQILRREVAKYTFVLTGRMPIVMPIIITKN